MKSICVLILLSFFLLISPFTIMAAETDSYDEKMALYKKTEALTHVPWYYLAAIDQYEKHTQEETDPDRVTSIIIEDSLWFGIENIDQLTDCKIIELFNGIGQDGDGNNHADPSNDEDILYTLASQIAKQGITEHDIKIALWEYYQRALTVKSIGQTAKVYKTFNTIALTDHAFPIPLQYNFSYQNTWGDSRGFGGRRIHEGTDIFANYSTPVKATAYGVVEIKGWNRFGGWRVGIRDINNNYHYFAHLHAFAEDLAVGDIVQPGDVIGSVGSSGYGPPGTSGKFPPHLHYGLYKDNGTNEWAFDPYPSLRAWEKQARK